ncbi:hypothetical protein SEA_PHLOP_2 [Gordonia phage Phlop]|uniref:Uncharacterized protein n=5 Tax=Wizardvirus TaxID=2169658 RepID=A0A4Y5TZB3_9CAUD|nr:hypothetical protein BH794_gp02 [Gordonia phage Wizard]YP_010096702.1 hypothetical protein KNT96_gp02 [Gordonia phage KimmyK]YP_010102253.1 hypothetical protein KNU56_gp02 [Gordonia phage Arri]YP_010102347.1 hypothetical protein KNU57_gp02 [Gordonia phage Valary]YP_010114921.1 hypothetical protein KNV78_gp02 [Gordonia phage Phlop]UVK63714.1 hypothetical protein SEA_PULLUMCAVEA_2 [Gordonia phage PullumCavea]ANA85308.1 hypothetical protein WIZARD_2 [Gordonia phage Wizard]AXH45941.1 hypothet
MNPETAVLDAIDALVDEQLAQEASGYDYNINQPWCPHPGCPAEWHGLPTLRCPGSAVAGPMKPPPWPVKPKSQARMAIIDADGNRTPIRSALVDFQMTPDPAVEQFREAWDGFRTTVVEGFRTLEVSFQGVSADLRRILEGSFAEGGEVVEQTPQQRALPRPSHTPPMWAARADGRRRR